MRGFSSRGLVGYRRNLLLSFGHLGRTLETPGGHKVTGRQAASRNPCGLARRPSLTSKPVAASALQRRVTPRTPERRPTPGCRCRGRGHAREHQPKGLTATTAGAHSDIIGAAPVRTSFRSPATTTGSSSTHQQPSRARWAHSVTPQNHAWPADQSARNGPSAASRNRTAVNRQPGRSATGTVLVRATDVHCMTSALDSWSDVCQCAAGHLDLRSAASLGVVSAADLRVSGHLLLATRRARRT